MDPKYAQRQATRRKTLFPLPTAKVGALRVEIAARLRNRGLNFYAIRQVMRIKPDQARGLVAKAARRGLIINKD